jgi:hypothetical protein
MMDIHSGNNATSLQQHQTDPSPGHHVNDNDQTQPDQQQLDDESAEAKKKRAGPKRRKVTHGTVRRCG